MTYVISPEIPKVNYLTKMDIYQTSVFAFAFYANIEFALGILFLSYQNSHGLASKKSRKGSVLS
jgi:hypothetical protein